LRILSNQSNRRELPLCGGATRWFYAWAPEFSTGALTNQSHAPMSCEFARCDLISTSVNKGYFADAVSSLCIASILCRIPVSHIHQSPSYSCFFGTVLQDTRGTSFKPDPVGSLDRTAKTHHCKSFPPLLRTPSTTRSVFATVMKSTRGTSLSSMICGGWSRYCRCRERFSVADAGGFYDGVDGVGAEVFQGFQFAARPADFYGVDFCGSAQAEMEA
jgi:hypothetical protein